MRGRVGQSGIAWINSTCRIGFYEQVCDRAAEYERDSSVVERLVTRYFRLETEQTESKIRLLNRTLMNVANLQSRKAILFLLCNVT